MLTAVSGLADSKAGTSWSLNNCWVLCSQSVIHTSSVIGRPVVFDRATTGTGGASAAVVALSPPAWDDRCSGCPVLAGAGGWGDPLERDPAAVLKDVRNELLSVERAEADYGVVVDTQRWVVEAAATTKRRAEIRTARGWREVPKVQRGDSAPLPGIARSAS